MRLTRLHHYKHHAGRRALTNDGIDARVLCNDGAQVGRKVEQGTGHGLGQRQASVELPGRHPGVGRVGADLQEEQRGSKRAVVGVSRLA